MKEEIVYRRKFLALALGALSIVGAIALAAEPSYADAKKPFVALANAYYGNSWRHELVEEFVKAADKAKADGKISDYVVVNGDGTVTQQIAQLSDLILKKPDLIIIDAASETALNGVIEKACSQGIVVLTFDGVATAPCAYRLRSTFSFHEQLAENVIKLMGGKGNLLVIRGLSGTTPDIEQYDYQMKAVKRYPDVKIVGTVYGGWSTSVSQAAVTNILPTLPHVDGVVSQGGGDEFGAARAFDLFGGDYAQHPPVIGGGGSSDFLAWWSDRAGKSDYKTISMSTDPASVVAALWYGLDILNGKIKPDKTTEVHIPALTITRDELSKYKDLPPSRVVTSDVYTPEWVEKNLESH
jgi:ribose transport system substrate-binding protein